MASELPGQRGDSITHTMEPHLHGSRSLDSSGNEKQQFEGVNTKVPYVTWRSMVLATFVSMGGILFGYDTGQISGFLAMSNYKMRYGIPKGNGEYYFTDVRAGLIVGLLAIGTLIGSLCGAPMADYFGRKYTISIWCLVVIVGLIVQISTPADVWYQMVIGRWVTGLGVGGCSLLVPMYQGESAPRHIRGAIICCYQLFITLGIFLSYCINLGTYTLEGTAQWRITLGITFLFAIVLGVGMIFFPESPRYEFRYGRVDSARATISKLYGVPENHQTITQEFHEIREQLEAEHAKDKKWHEFFTDTRMFYRLILGMVLQSLQQLTGANYFFYYGTVIFKGAGLENSFITQVILGAVNFGTTFGGLYVVENFGRRKSLITGAFLMFVFFMVFASVGHFVLDVEHPQNTPGAGKALIVVGCLFVATYVSSIHGQEFWKIANVFSGHDVGPHDLGYYCRDLPAQAPLTGNGPQHCG
jgi:SP family sugar:H+ symporter-like MFS transporter